MAKVLGIGGIFFKSPDPAKRKAWYGRWLQLPADIAECAIFRPQGLPAGAYAVWAPFAADTGYFGTGHQEFMLNLMVDDLDAALTQVAEGRAEVVGAVNEHDYGRFGWFVDPDGHKVELWQPK